MENPYEQKTRTYICKLGDSEAQKQINEIIQDGWKITCQTPNGTVTITTFNK